VRQTKPILLLALLSLPASATTVETLLEGYRSEGAGPFSAESGAALWRQQLPAAKGPSPRSCNNCHGDDLTRSGKHARTQKPIKPLAPAANPQRLTKAKKIEKWFKRNCKWSWGRVCTPQEKGDLLLFIQSHN